MSTTFDSNALAAEATAGHEPYVCACGETACTKRRVLAKDPFSGEMFTYIACRACGLERMLERPAASAIGRYYPTSYGCYTGCPTGHQVSLTERLKALVYRTYYDPTRPPDPLLRVLLWPIRRRSVMAFRQPATRRVFEFGAGRGGDLVTFRDAGWQATGCEPSAQACAAAASRGLSIQNCLAEEAEIPPGTSCVFMNNVFEHLYDPAAILAKVHTALTDDGVLVLIVPNHDCWTARVFGAAWPGYDAPRHIWGWTPSAITRVLARAGFEIEYINQQAPVNLWSATLEGVNRPTPTPPVLRWAARTKMVARLFVPLGWVAAAAGHGDYIRVVAHKQPT
jgi:SAM-dependent methyltransferase